MTLPETPDTALDGDPAGPTDAGGVLDTAHDADTETTGPDLPATAAKRDEGSSDSGDGSLPTMSGDDQTASD